MYNRFSNTVISVFDTVLLVMQNAYGRLDPFTVSTGEFAGVMFWFFYVRYQKTIFCLSLGFQLFEKFNNFGVINVSCLESVNFL